ncbi:MAG TPA: sulfatase-like hydrolase/transferase [Chthoniobacter sp.]|jgi:arylsulfatase A-like enzyme
MNPPQNSGSGLAPRTSWRSLGFAFLGLFLLGSCILAADSPAPRPNILFILADDLGWGDVGFHHGNVPTPNLDHLHAEGLELLQHYVYPVCSPTRCAFLSGRYASRFSVTTPQNPRAFRWDTVTLARALKSVGYDTALCGKWHLGSKPAWGPQLFGFDHSYGSLAGGVGPWDHHYKMGEFTHTWHRDGKLVEEKGHVTDLITKEAVEWLEARTDKPFFLYVPFTAVHIPMREPDEIVRRVPASITQPSLRQYGANVMHLDDSVGKILAALEKTGKAGNTLVIFSSDNGAIPGVENNDPLYPPDNYEPGPAGGSNEPLHGKKGEVYEGGIHTACVARWPGHLQPGKFHGLAHITDWMPTFCALAGYKPEKDLKWDGQNIWPALSGAEPIKPRTIYVAGPGFRSKAFRDGDWKLVLTQASKKAPEKSELFNLGSDPNERADVAGQFPEVVVQMRAKLEQASTADHDADAND